MGETVLSTNGLCPNCRGVVMKWSGIRVPSDTKKPRSRREVEHDYILICPKCGFRVCVPTLPECSRSFGGGQK